MTEQKAEQVGIEPDECEHPAAAVIVDENGDHLCARCDAEWWEDPL